MYVTVGLVALGCSWNSANCFSPGRAFEVDDMIADAAGACIGLMLDCRFVA